MDTAQLKEVARLRRAASKSPEECGITHMAAHLAKLAGPFATLIEQRQHADREWREGEPGPRYAEYMATMKDIGDRRLADAVISAYMFAEAAGWDLDGLIKARVEQLESRSKSGAYL